LKAQSIFAENDSLKEAWRFANLKLFKQTDRGAS